jgi:hypothetical protein
MGDEVKSDSDLETDEANKEVLNEKEIELVKKWAISLAADEPNSMLLRTIWTD